MMNLPSSVTLKCLFCDNPLTGPEGKQYASGDQVKCTACGASNDFDSVLQVATEEVTAQAAAEIQKHLTGLFKKR